MSYRYEGVAYKQGLSDDAPWLVSFVATAEDVDTWAGIPRRSEKGFVGFQRPDDSGRLIKASEFFKAPQNQSPTSLIIGAHKATDDAERLVSLTFQDTDTAANIRKCVIEINFDPDTFTLAKAKQLLQLQIRHRLASQPSGIGDDPATGAAKADESAVSQENDVSYDEEDSESSDAAESSDDSDDAEDTEEPVELGRSLLFDLLNKLEDDAWCLANEDDIKDLAKPCTVIDGQHRLKGAAHRERRIPFSVIALFDCSWREQVFQFTVVNYTAKGIPDQFITANAALSLTGDDLAGLKDRLRQAGVKVLEYDLMSVVNFDPQSPFYELVSMAPSGTPPDKLGYKTMVKIAKTWYTTKGKLLQPALKLLTQNAFPEFNTGTKKSRDIARKTAWQESEWGEYFKAFWEEVRDHYRTQAVAHGQPDPWRVGECNLLITIVLLELQKRLLTVLANQDDDWFVLPEEIKTNLEARSHFVRKLKRLVGNNLKKLPLDLFTKKWGTSQLNTGAGQDALAACFRMCIEDRDYDYNDSTLVKGLS